MDGSGQRRRRRAATTSHQDMSGVGKKPSDGGRGRRGWTGKPPHRGYRWRSSGRMLARILAIVIIACCAGGAEAMQVGVSHRGPSGTHAQHDDTLPSQGKCEWQQYRHRAGDICGVCEQPPSQIYGKKCKNCGLIACNKVCQDNWLMTMPCGDPLVQAQLAEDAARKAVTEHMAQGQAYLPEDGRHSQEEYVPTEVVTHQTRTGRLVLHDNEVPTEIATQSTLVATQMAVTDVDEQAILQVMVRGGSQLQRGNEGGNSCGAGSTSDAPGQWVTQQALELTPQAMARPWWWISVGERPTVPELLQMATAIPAVRTVKHLNMRLRKRVAPILQNSIDRMAWATEKRMKHPSEASRVAELEASRWAWLAPTLIKRAAYLQQEEEEADPADGAVNQLRKRSRQLVKDRLLKAEMNEWEELLRDYVDEM